MFSDKDPARPEGFAGFLVEMINEGAGSGL